MLAGYQNIKRGYIEDKIFRQNGLAGILFIFLVRVTLQL